MATAQDTATEEPLPPRIEMQNGESTEFPVHYALFTDRMGQSLIVTPRARAGDPAGQLELRITDQAYYNTADYDFDVREVATINGPGIGNEGLVFFVANDESREAFIQMLDTFTDQARNFRQRKAEIKNMEEPWMGRGDSDLSGSRKVGTLQTDFIRKPSEVTLNWDLGKDRLWLSLDGLVNIDSRLAAPLLEMVLRIPDYAAKRSELSETLKQKNRRVDESLNLAPSEEVEEIDGDMEDILRPLPEEGDEREEADEESESIAS